jgi:acetylornithine/N-succinyldiaminopimelate aminotransferase
MWRSVALVLPLLSYPELIQIKQVFEQRAKNSWKDNNYIHNRISKTMKFKEIVEKDRKYIAQTYKRQPIALVEGRGAVVRDSDGREYIDCFSGLAVLNVGHSHPKVVEAIKNQAERIIHTSNLYYIPPQVELAELLYRISGGYQCFICNSGTEANEAAIKLVRKYTGKKEIIAAENSFHGRTYGSLSATGQEKYKKSFGPMLEGFKHVKFGDVEEIKDAIGENTAAVLLEPIQGEGGVVVPPAGYLKEVSEVCKERDVLLVLDEVQTGFGRVGRMFAFQLYGVEPDIFTVAKALGGGFPIGAMLAKPKVMKAFGAGDHAATFGGNHLACAAAKASIEALVEEKLVENAEKLGEYLIGRLRKLKEKHSIIRDVRGAGLMVGVELDRECYQLVDKMREEGVLLNCTHDNVVRFLPPLNIEREQLDKVLLVFEKVLAQLEEERS